MKFVVFALAASVASASCARPAAKPTRTSVPEHATDFHPPPPAAPGPANLTLSCSPPPGARCDDPGYQMVVLGDVVESCVTEANGTSIRLQIKSSNDPNNGILVAFDGYRGPNRYTLDDPSARYVAVDDHVSLAQCEGPPRDNIGKHVTARDPNCGSPACTVDVRDATPDAPFPKSLTFHVSCASMCENNSDVTCGPVSFTTRADCT